MSAAITHARRRRVKEDRREAVLAAARRIFFESGFHRATVENIALEAGVAKGTVYLYFETKETILAHLLLEGLENLRSRLESAYAEAAPHSGETRLRRLAQAYLQFFKDEQDSYRLMMAFDRGRFQECVPAEVYQQILLRSVRAVRWAVKALEQGIEEGAFAVADARRAAGMFWAAVNGVLVLISHPLRREILDQEVETLYAGVVEAMIRGLRSDAPPIDRIRSTAENAENAVR